MSRNGLIALAPAKRGITHGRVKAGRRVLIAREQSFEPPLDG